MKIHWEPKDIIPGRKISKNHSLESWMIGWGIDDSTVYYVIINQIQGEVSRKYTKQSLADYLTEWEYFPIIPLP